MSSSIQVCKDLSEAIELCEPKGLYLKPMAKLNVSVQLPILKNPGKSISNWEVMEKLKKLIRPGEFTTLKVSKTSLEFIRFEGEVENRIALKQAISRIDGNTIKLSGFPDPLKVKAAEAKLHFPSRHDWDSFFRDARNMNEMKPGERPDTIVFSDLPIKWFSDSHSSDVSKPSEHVVKEVFESLGEIRCLDVPMLDRYQKDLNKSVGVIKTFSFSQDLTFETYIQFKDYVSFVKAMDTLRGKKLLYKSPDGQIFISPIKADFDKTKHLSAKNIQRRLVEHQKLIILEKQREAQVYIERAEEEKQKEENRLKNEKEEVKKNERYHRKMKRRAQRLEERKKAERISIQQRKRVVLQRRTEAKELVTVLLENFRKRDVAEKMAAIEKERLKQQQLEEKKRLTELLRQQELERAKQENLQRQENKLREKLLRNLKVREEKRTEELRERLREELAGRNVLKSVLVPSIKPVVINTEKTGYSFGKKVFKDYSSDPREKGPYLKYSFQKRVRNRNYSDD